MQVVFLHGPAASGKYTIGSRLSALTGLPLFHNHLAVDAAKALFDFGTPAFNRLRATVWLTAFAEAAASDRSFIFTFHPEASVEPALIDRLVATVRDAGGAVRFVALDCPDDTVLERIGNADRAPFGKLTDRAFYRTLQQQGAFDFPPLPTPLLTIDTSRHTPDEAAARIASALSASQDAT